MGTPAGSTPAPEHWGLDPMLRSYVRLFVCDVQSLTVYDFDQGEVQPSATSAISAGVFFHNQRPVTKVDLMGVVVKSEVKERFNKYTIDDGTGVISCTKWKNNDAVATTGNGELPTSLMEKLRSIIPVESEVACELGDYVNVLGSLKVFRNLVEITVEKMAIMRDPNIETARMLELLMLYIKSYDKPFSLPSGVTLNTTESSSSQQKMVKDSLKKFIYTMKTRDVSAKNILCDMRELDIISEAMDTLMTDTNIHSALEELAQDGFLFKSCKSYGNYRVIQFDSDLQDTILDILGKAGKIKKYSEQGCHYMYVKDQVCLNMQFSKIQPKAVFNCLQILEKNSKVYSVSSDRHFLLT